MTNKGDLRWCDTGKELYRIVQEITDDDDRVFTQEHLDAWNKYKDHFESCEKCGFFS